MTTIDRRFDRAYRLTIGSAGGTGIVADESFEIEFEVKKDLKKDPNQCTFRLFGVLDPSKREALIKPDQKLIFEAGYKREGIRRLIAGNVIDGFVEFNEAADVIVNITMLESLVAMRDSTVSLSIPPGGTSDDAIRSISAQMGLPLTMGPEMDRRVWPSGFSYYGPAHRALDRSCAASAAEWSIQDESVQVLSRGKTTAKLGVVLDADSGLIGSPERVLDKSSQRSTAPNPTTGKPVVSTKKGRVTGWKVRSLLLPEAVPGDKIRVESRTVTGWFKIEEVNHSGKLSSENNWTTELTLVAI